MFGHLTGALAEIVGILGQFPSIFQSMEELEEVRIDVLPGNGYVHRKKYLCVDRGTHALVVYEEEVMGPNVPIAPMGLPMGKTTHLGRKETPALPAPRRIIDAEVVQPDLPVWKPDQKTQKRQSRRKRLAGSRKKAAMGGRSPGPAGLSILGLPAKPVFNLPLKG